MSKRTSIPTILAAALIGALLAPVGAHAVGEVVQIANPAGRVAQVTRAAQLTAAEASPESYFNGIGTVHAGQGCKLIAAAPANKGLIIKRIRYNVTSVPSPGVGTYVITYVGTGCTNYVDSINPAGIGQTTSEFEPGLAIPKGQGLYATGIGLSSELWLSGYVVGGGVVPGGSTAPARQDGADALGKPVDS